MSIGRVLALAVSLAGCDRMVVLTAVEGPDESQADPDADDTLDAAEDAVDQADAEGPEPAPPEALDASLDSAPAMNTPLDASGADVAIDDASEDAGPVRDAGPDAMLPACGGARALDLCWYLGVPGASCRQTCGDKGGFDTRAIARLGTSAQGGNLRACTRVLGALGYMGNVTPGYRSDGVGLGCHLWEQRDGWWLDTMPDWSATASISVASIACACVR